MQRKIGDIDPERDIRVRILGRVIDKAEGVIIVDDGSSKAEIIAEEFDAIDVDDVVRAFCRVLPLEQGYELRAEIIQKLNNLDMELHRKVYGE